MPWRPLTEFDRLRGDGVDRLPYYCGGTRKTLLSPFIMDLVVYFYLYVIYRRQKGSSNYISSPYNILQFPSDRVESKFFLEKFPIMEENFSIKSSMSSILLGVVTSISSSDYRGTNFSSYTVAENKRVFLVSPGRTRH